MIESLLFNHRKVNYAIIDIMPKQNQNYLSKDQLPLLKLLAKKHNKIITFIDLETNGLLMKEKVHPESGVEYKVPNDEFAITEVGLLHITPDGQLIESGLLVNPDEFMPAKAQEVTHITPEMVLYQKPWKAHIPKMVKWMENNIMVGFNTIGFDFKALVRVNAKYGYVSDVKYPRDVRSMYLRATNMEFGKAGKLVNVAERFGITLEGDAHRAGYDIAITALLAERFLELYGLELFDCLDATMDADDVHQLDENGDIVKRKVPFQHEVIDFYTQSPCADIKLLASILGVEDKKITSSLRRALEEGWLRSTQVIPEEEVVWLNTVIDTVRDKAWKGASDGKYGKIFRELEKYNPPFELTYTHVHVALADNPVVKVDYMDDPSFKVLDMVPWE